MDAKEAIRAQLATPNPQPAIICVNGELGAYADSRAEANDMIDEIEKQNPDWTEIAIMVYKPRYGAYLRESYRSRG